MIAAGRAAGAAPTTLPLASLLIGSVALAAAATALVFDPAALAGAAATPASLALLHAVTLGYLAFLFAGTLQQLLPVLLVTRLALPWLGSVVLPLLALGATGVVLGFALGFQPLALAAGGALASVALWAVAVQAVATYARARRESAGRRRSAGSAPRGDGAHRVPAPGPSGRPDPAAAGLVTATVYLALTVTLGFLLAAALHAPPLARVLGYPVQLHLTLGLFGAFLLGIAAAGRKLLAMFALSKGTAAFRVKALTFLVHGAIAAELLHAFARLPLRGVALALLAAAGGLQLWEVSALLRVRLRKRLEPPVRRYLLGHAFLPVAGALAASGRREAAGAALLLGFVVLATSGMQVKIASFLTWQARYAARGAGGGAPLLRDMLLPGLEPATTAGLAGGAAAATMATATHASGWAVAAGMLLAVGAWAQLAQTLAVLFGRHRGSARRPARAPARLKENT